MAEVEFKIYDKVKIIANISQHRFKIGDEVTIFRAYNSKGMYDACNKKGDCCWVTGEEIKLIKKTKIMNINKFIKAAVENTANKLLKANNTVTTLELKMQLRKDYPHFLWNQKSDGVINGVSDWMIELQKEGKYDYKDNGNHRIYSMVAGSPLSVGTSNSTGIGTSTKSSKVLVSNKPNVVTAGVAINMIDTQRKNFVSATIVKNGTDIVVTSAFIKSMKKSPLSYLSNKQVKELNIGGTTYQVQ